MIKDVQWWTALQLLHSMNDVIAKVIKLSKTEFLIFGFIRACVVLNVLIGDMEGICPIKSGKNFLLVREAVCKLCMEDN